MIQSVTAQTLADALRYSNLQHSGTARLMTTGGALGALGGDFGVLSINPAGVATYRKSSLEITPSLNFIKTKSSFANGTTDDTAPNFNLNNIGMVFSKVNTDKEANWKTSNFALGINRTNIFTQSVFFQGTTQGSIQERWVSLANGFSPDQLYTFEEGIAFDANLIYNPDGNDLTQYAGDLDATSLIQKGQTIERSGSVTDVVVAYGGNFRHKLSIGLAMGLPLVQFDEVKNYTETDTENASDFFNTMTYTETLATTGVGINLKLGIILRVNQALRVGAAFHTPTFFTLSDNYSTSVTSDLTINSVQETLTADSPVSNFSYELTTPWRVIGSVAYIFGRSGFVTGEVEYVAYNNAKFNISDDPNFEQDLNTEIETTLTEAVNIRVGGEMTFGTLALRGGYGVNLSPYDAAIDTEDEIVQNVSIGVGLREKRFLMDLGYLHSFYSEEYLPYTSNSTNIVRVINDITRSRVVFTIGFRF